LVADGYISPLYSPDDLVKYKIPKTYIESVAIKTGEIINKNSLNLGAYESLKKDAIELYPFLRDVYEQKREAEIDK
jgi:phospholipid-binding lipoprotein MlaA